MTCSALNCVILCSPFIKTLQIFRPQIRRLSANLRIVQYVLTMLSYCGNTWGLSITQQIYTLIDCIRARVSECWQTSEGDFRPLPQSCYHLLWSRLTVVVHRSNEQVNLGDDGSRLKGNSEITGCMVQYVCDHTGTFLHNKR